MKTDRSELAIWAEGTRFTTDELVREYAAYCTRETEAGREPDDEGRWADEVMELDCGNGQRRASLAENTTKNGAEE